MRSRIQASVVPLSQSMSGRSSTTLRPVRHPQAISLSEPVCCRDDLTDALRCDLAVVNRDGEALVVHAYSRDLRQAAA